MKYQKYRICVLGSKGVGKTAYIQSKSIQHDNEYIFININNGKKCMDQTTRYI